jgi:CBS domain-containing protein
MQLKDLSTEDVITVQADGSIDDAIQLLQQHRVRHLPVVRDGVLVGMVSEGDVLVAVGGVLSGQRVSTHDATVQYAGPTVVEQIMTTGVITLSAEDRIVAAARLMLEQRISAVVLVSNETIVGIVTESDYMRQFVDESTVVPDACRHQSVANHMAAEVVTTAPTESVFALIRKMGKRIRHLPVVEGGTVVGILSDHDVRRAMALNKIECITQPGEQIRLMENFDAGRIMSRNVETTKPTATLTVAAKQMIDNKIGALPVIEAGDLAGIITETDLLRACVSALGDLP